MTQTTTRTLVLASMIALTAGCAATPAASSTDDPSSPSTSGGGNGNGNGNKDAGATSSPDGGATTSDAGGGVSQPDGGYQQGGSPWLKTQGNHILLGGKPWHGRGANLHDPRSCGACVGTPNAQEVNRRMDELVSWGANFIRLVLESRQLSETPAYDSNYLNQIKQIVAHAAAKPGVYVLVSLWSDPGFSALGWPSNPGTTTQWKALATAFANEPRVLFGIVNEPEQNYDGSLDAQVWSAMNDNVATIRAAETAAGGQQHIVAVQGTGGWGRFLNYYVTHPITAGGGTNVAYETHVYDPSSQFGARFENPGKTLPVIIGEFGPTQGYQTLQEAQDLMQRAENAEIPYLAWTFHMRCPPNLLVDNSGGGCGVNMNLVPSPQWGVPFKAQLAKPW
jgi:endoglucanase